MPSDIIYGRPLKHEVHIVGCLVGMPQSGYLSPIWQFWQLLARAFGLFQCLYEMPCPWQAQKPLESQPMRSNKELKKRSKIAYSKKTVPLENGPLKHFFDRSDNLRWTSWSWDFQKYKVCWIWPKKSMKRTQIRLPSIMYTDSFENYSVGQM